MEIIEKLRELFLEIEIELVIPSYIKIFEEYKKKCILAYKHRLDLQETPIKRKIEKSDQSNLDLDLTGSPLKVDYFNESKDVSILKSEVTKWKLGEEKHSYMSFEEARSIIDRYNYLYPNQNREEYSGIWCIYKNKDEDSTLSLMGSSCEKNMFSRNIITIDGFHSRNDNYSQIKSMIQKHLQQADTLRNTITSYEVKATYEIFGSYQDNHNMNASLIENLSVNGSINLEVYWDKPDYAPKLSSSATLIVQSIVGHYDSQAIVLWKNLNIMQDFVDLLDACKDLNDLTNIVLPASGESNDNELTLLNKIEALLKETNEVNQLRRWARQENKSENNDLLLSVLGANERWTRDFTDLLWEILICCTNYIELTECLYFVFNKISEREYRPLIHSENNTSIATFIRKANNGQAVIRSLTGCQPLEIVIEIGLLKMFRDYQFIFMSCNLVTSEQFSNIAMSGLSTHIDNQNHQDRRSQFPLTENVTRKSTLMKERESTFKNRCTLFRSTENISKQFGSMHGLKKIDTYDLWNSYKYEMKKLVQLHTVLEISLLIHSNTCPQQKTLVKFTSYAIDKLLNEESPVKSFEDIKMFPLVELNIPTVVKEFPIDNHVQSSWRLKIKSENDRRGIINIFHQSLRPYFPPQFSDATPGDNEVYFCSNYLKIWNKFN